MLCLTLVLSEHCSRRLVVCSDAHWPSKLCCDVLFREKRLSPGSPSKQLTPFLSILSLTLTFNTLTDACRVWGVFCGFSEHWTTWPCLDLHSWENCLQHFPLVNKLSRSWMMDLICFGNGLVTLFRLMRSIQHCWWLSFLALCSHNPECSGNVKIQVYIFATHLDSSISCHSLCFIEVLTLGSQMHLISLTWLLLLIPMDIVRVYLVFHTLLLNHCLNIC